MKSKIIILLLFLFLQISSPASGISTVSAGCDNAKPGEPVLTSVVPGDKSVTLTWVEPPENVTYYLIQYGVSKDAMNWGLPNIGGKGTTQFTVNDLENGTRYYFQVRAGNGCEPGSFSNTLSTEAGIKLISEKKPNLSLHKVVLGEATEPAKLVKNTVKSSATPAATVDPLGVECGSRCNVLPLLGGEVVALFAFFYLARRVKKVKPVFSVIVPAVAIGAYYQYYAVCSDVNFTCNYFVPLSITAYILILIPQKFLLLSRHSGVKNIKNN